MCWASPSAPSKTGSTRASCLRPRGSAIACTGTPTLSIRGLTSASLARAPRRRHPRWPRRGSSSSPQSRSRVARRPRPRPNSRRFEAAPKHSLTRSWRSPAAVGGPVEAPMRCVNSGAERLPQLAPGLKEGFDRLCHPSVARENRPRRAPAGAPLCSRAAARNAAGAAPARLVFPSAVAIPRGTTTSAS